MTAAPAPIVGGWRLSTFTIGFSDDRPPVFPFGETPVGHIVYSASGMMSAVLSRSDRGQSGAGRLETADRIDVTAKAAAFDSYLSYGGRYQVVGDTITHHVDVALVPELVGTDLERTFVIDGDTLRISYAITAKSGVERRYNLVFVRDS